MLLFLHSASSYIVVYDHSASYLKHIKEHIMNIAEENDTEKYATLEW